MKSGCEALENQWIYVDGTVRLPAAMQEWEERRGPSGPFDRYWSEICQNVERTGESKSLGCAHERHRVRYSRVDVLCISAARDTSQRSPSPRADLWGFGHGCLCEVRQYFGLVEKQPSLGSRIAGDSGYLRRPHAYVDRL